MHGENNMPPSSKKKLLTGLDGLHGHSSLLLHI